MYKRQNFTALTSLNFSHAGLSGAFPEFTNPVLTSLDLTYTAISGGTYAGDTTYVIPAETFANTPLLTSLSILSSNLLTSPIHPDAFSNLGELTNLYYYSYRRTSGAVPNLGGCPKLSSLQISHNAFTGNLPSLNSLSNLRTAYLLSLIHI